MNYPKMLYKGNQENYQTVVADDEDHESELVEQGWCEYGELEECSPLTSGVVGDGTALDRALIPVEQFDTLVEKLAATEEQLIATQSEYTTFMNDVGAMKVRINLLQGDLTPVGATSDSEQKPVGYSDLKIDELQALLDEKGIKYLKRDGKDTLIGLLNGHSN